MLYWNKWWGRHLWMFALFATLVLLIFCWLHWDYTRRGQTDTLGPQSPRTAIVLTGTPKRVGVALKRMEEGFFDRMVVTGFELELGAFADYMKLSSDLRRALESGRIVLLKEATSTFENAIETLCWLKQNPDVNEITLITSESHMPRASFVFERALPPGFKIEKLVSDRGPDNRMPSVLSTEWRNYLGSRIVTLFPQYFWRKGTIEPCE